MERAQASQVRCAVYRRRRPERTLLYRRPRCHFETYLALAREGHFDAAVPAYVEREFRRYRECGILAHGFARAFCDQKTRLPDRVFLQGARRVPRVQCRADSGDGSASHRARYARHRRCGLHPPLWRPAQSPGAL
jgi:hypothetical protein